MGGLDGLQSDREIVHGRWSWDPVRDHVRPRPSLSWAAEQKDEPSDWDISSHGCSLSPYKSQNFSPMKCTANLEGKRGRGRKEEGGEKLEDREGKKRG